MKTRKDIITPATNSKKSRRSFRQSALLAESLHTTGMRGSAASHTDKNLRRFVPTINCRGNKLYNMLFPAYSLWLIPPLWLVAMPANFIIDSAVVLITLSVLKLPRLRIYKKTILKVWGYGFLADLAGSMALLMVSLIGGIFADLPADKIGKAFENFHTAINYNPYSNFFALIITLGALALSGLCIYQLNLKYVFEKVDLDVAHKKRLALMLAIFTAPYTFLIPMEPFY